MRSHDDYIRTRQSMIRASDLELQKRLVEGIENQTQDHRTAIDVYKYLRQKHEEIINKRMTELFGKELEEKFKSVDLHQCPVRRTIDGSIVPSAALLASPSSSWQLVGFQPMSEDSFYTTFNVFHRHRTITVKSIFTKEELISIMTPQSSYLSEISVSTKIPIGKVHRRILSFINQNFE